ncbi:MAG: M55 family metallopeptidase [Eubacteriales bacterium]|nr:M55 family metallopeptidase [Eubacteriales bacterium]
MKKAEKVYISVDIEGMEGVVSRNQTSRGKNDYPLARKRLTYDVNEAIRAAVDCGATEIVVSEGHGDLENLLLDELHPAADLISGAISPSLQMQGIEDGFDAMIVFGHAGGGMSLGGVLDHTYNGRRVHAMRLNGMTVNTEAICNAVIAGHYGVPLAAIIGDRAVVEEVHAYLPSCEGIIVKEGITRLSAKSVNPVRAREMIYTGVRKALSELDCKQLLVLEEPMTLEIDFNYSQTADVAALVPGTKRLSPRTIAYTGTAEDVFRLQTLLIACITDEYPF